MTRRLLGSIGLVGLLAAAACGGPAPADEAVPATDRRDPVIVLDDNQMKNGGITVAAVATQSLAPEIAAPAMLALDETRTAHVGSLQEGLILRTLAQVGDRVRAGQLLATMHGHAMHDAWAGYRKARAEERRLENELTFATDAHARLQRLYDQKAVALQQVKRADVERVAAVEHLVAAKAEILRSIEELEHVGVEIDLSTPDAETRADDPIPVRTPMAGAVLERLVTPGTTVTPGSPLYVISDLSVLWALAQVDEANVSQVRAGQPVAVRVTAYPDEVFPGTVTFVADRIDPDTRRLVVRASVANPSQRLKPEMFATVTLTSSAARDVLVVPRRAIQAIDGRATVFVAEGGNRFVPRTVTTTESGLDPVEITSGLQPGDRIVVDGSFLLKSELLKPAEGS